MPEIGPTAPDRMLVAVRAMVPVTGIPPNRIEPILAVPCATSSQFERCLRPDMPSATTAESNDSIAPRSAMAAASGRTACALAKLNGGSPAETASRQFAEAGGDCHDVEIKSPGKCCGRGDRNEEGWPARPPLAQAKNDQNRSNADGDGLQIDAASRLPQGLKFGQERGRLVRHSESKQLPELAGKNDDGDTRGEANRDRKRDVLHISAESHETAIMTIPAIRVARASPS